MSYLLDTNILVRLADKFDARHEMTTDALRLLRGRGELLQVTSQVLIEFRNVATRPVQVNGLGFSAIEAETDATQFAALFPLLDDIPAIFPAWKRIVATLGVVGKQVHDARLVAVCHAHGVTHLVTFNGAHFARLAGVSPGLVVVDPAVV